MAALRIRHFVTLAPIVVAFGVAIARLSTLPAPAPFLMPAAPSAEASPAARSEPGAATTGSAGLDGTFLPNPNHLEAHSASLVALRDGRVRAFWLAGNEGSMQAVISSSVFDPRSGAWSAPATVMDAGRAGAALQRYVRKVGNAVATREADGSLSLFFVTVSVGGWAGSSISVSRSSDDGASWSPPRRLVTSPFMNLSTLVRQPPLPHADGSLSLPVYHEFVHRFGEVLRLDPARRVLDKQRLSIDPPALQPLLLPRDEAHALVLMRNGADSPPRSVLVADTDDAGRTWSRPVSSPLPNPGTPVSGLTLADGRLLLALNDVQIRRRRLSLMISSDQGATWTLLHTFEDQGAAGEQGPDKIAYQAQLRKLAVAAGMSEPDAAATAQAALYPMCRSDARCDFEYSYPYLLQASADTFHLVYTWNRAGVRALRFDRAWLDERVRLAAAGPADAAKPVETQKPPDAVAPADAAKPSDASKPADVSKPADPAEKP